MKLVEYKETVLYPLRQATLCFLVRDNEVLLAMKKRGFAEGKWNGAGGKVEAGESIEEAAKRELCEEIGITPVSLTRVGSLNFYVPQNPEWNQQVIVFLVDMWKGEPTETEEMAPKWFNKKDIPFSSMWADDIYWLPKVLDGKKFEGDFLMNGEEILEFNLLVN